MTTAANSRGDWKATPARDAVAPSGTDGIREHWDEILRLVASLKAGTVLPSAMLKRLAAYQRQNQLDLALQGHAVPAELLAHTSPLMWEHIGFSGDFLWDRAAATAGHHRPLNLGRERMAA
jgi:hypothetical protein